jgi:hypothetical protein
MKIAFMLYYIDGMGYGKKIVNCDLIDMLYVDSGAQFSFSSNIRTAMHINYIVPYNASKAMIDYEPVSDKIIYDDAQGIKGRIDILVSLYGQPVIP